ncbi:hypothetical protein BDW69DRAFT_187690 [Aspergillus filifer]
MPPINEETLTLIRHSKPITPLSATQLFNSLPPVPASSLLGSWTGTCALTNHPGTEALADVRWIGKDFHSFEDVDPIIVSPPDAGGSGKRVVNSFMGKARVWEIKYNGVVSAAMIYNDKPIIDYFRRVDKRTVMGVMDSLGDAADHGLFFILERFEGRDGMGRKL